MTWNAIIVIFLENKHKIILKRILNCTCNLNYRMQILTFNLILCRMFWRQTTHLFYRNAWKIRERIHVKISKKVTMTNCYSFLIQKEHLKRMDILWIGSFMREFIKQLTKQVWHSFAIPIFRDTFCIFIIFTNSS